MARTAVVAGTASAVGGRVHHRQQQKWAAQEAPAAPPQYQQQPAYQQPQPVYQQPQQVPDQRSAAPAPDRLEQLKQLGELKAQGVLTEQEFEAEKAKILAG
jgi:hypothetical protein